MRRFVSITRDVSGPAYRALLSEACDRYSAFSLVWRDQLSFDPSAHAIRQELRRFQIAHARSSHWPGTRLIGSRAQVIRYSLDAADTGVLDRSESLFGWRAPRLPEDLCFYDATGACALVTVAHEHCAWFADLDWLSLLPPDAAAELDSVSIDTLGLLQPDA